MSRIKVERIGGFAGFGLPGSHLKSRGEVELSELSAADRKALEVLFERKGPAESPAPDSFRYRITRETDAGSQTVEAPEDRIPLLLRNCVKDTLD